MSDAVADNQPDTPVSQIDHVVPVAAHLKWPAGGLIAHCESLREISRPQDRVLERQCRFTLLVDLMHPVQGLPEATSLHGQQSLIFEGERALLGEVNPHDEHTIRMLECDSCRPRLRGVRPQQVAVAQRRQPLLKRSRQFRPLRLLADRHQSYSVTGCFGRPPVVGKCDGEDATGPPQSSQFLSCHPQGVIDGIGLSELPVESMFATCCQSQCQRGMTSEVADQFQVIGAECLLLRIPATAMTPSIASSATRGMTIADRSPTSVKPSIGY